MTTKVSYNVINTAGLDSETVGGLAPVAIAAPIGSVIMWPLDTPHDDYLEMNGSSKDTTTHADLFAIIGYTYGGSGASFNVPDYRGQIPRGFDNGATVDPDAASRTDRGDGTTGDNVGTKQADEIKTHEHDITAPGTNATAAGGDNWVGGTNSGSYTIVSQPKGGNETRPKNISVMFCIKYK